MVFRKMRAIARRTAGARDAGLHVDHDALRFIEQAGFCERQEREECRRGIAARIGHERGIAYVVPVAQSGRTPRRPAARPSPGTTGTRGRIANPKRARQVDDPHAGADQRRRQLGGRAFRHGQERESTSEARRAGLSGSTFPSQTLASRGRGRAAESALDDIAISSRTCGCRARSARSS